MRKPIIAGNWKMYKSFDEAVSFVETVLDKIPSNDQVDAVICAPAIYLPGSSLPSISSKEAPPPVEMWSILSATLNFSTAAAESPPPITV